MDMEDNFNQADLDELRPSGIENGYHGGYTHYNYQYRNPFLGYGFIGPLAGGLLGGLAAGALIGSYNSYGYGGGYPYYGGYPYPPPYYYGGYGYPYWRYY